MKKIVGVDFSGARTDDPWITMGVLEDKHLNLTCCEPIPREDLKKRLRKLPDDAVAAIDFPFGVPHQFALELDRDTCSMPDLWRLAALEEYKWFKESRDCFVKVHRELIRAGDTYFDGPLSPLKTGGPNMLPMTFRGMEMLHELWKDGCRVPPLRERGHDGPTLLETMPGVWLRYYDLPHEKFKGTSDEDLANREKILEGLKTKPKVSVKICESVRNQCLRKRDGHNGLDSAIAAIAGALWVENRDIFLEPHSTLTVADTSTDPKRKKRMERISPGLENTIERKAARLEGWIYAPKPIETATGQETLKS